MGKTRDQLERDCAAALKFVLSEMERLAAMPPKEAAEPYAFNERRRQVMRRLWTLWKEALAYDPRVV